MKPATKIFFIPASCLLIAQLVSETPAMASSDQGEALFKRRCNSCHLDPSRMSKVKSVVKTLRFPPAFMPKFDQDRITDDEAKEIEKFVFDSIAKKAAADSSKNLQK